MPSRASPTQLSSLDLPQIIPHKYQDSFGHRHRSNSHLSFTGALSFQMEVYCNWAQQRVIPTFAGFGGTEWSITGNRLKIAGVKWNRGWSWSEVERWPYPGRSDRSWRRDWCGDLQPSFFRRRWAYFNTNDPGRASHRRWIVRFFLQFISIELQLPSNRVFFLSDRSLFELLNHQNLPPRRIQRRIS